MGHQDHFHGLAGVPHGPSTPHDHLNTHLEEAEPIAAGDVGDAGMLHWETLWIDLGGES